MKKFLTFIAWASGIAAILSVLAPLILGQFFATTVTLLAPGSEIEVATNKEFWVPGDPVAEIYGIPASQSATLLFVDDAKILRPTEDPSLRLYMVDKQRGDNPLQLKSVWFFAKFAVIGFAIASLLSWLGRTWLVRRARRHTTA